MVGAQGMESIQSGLLRGRAAGAQLLLNLFILVYGASFTLTLTVFQAFMTAGGSAAQAQLAQIMASGRMEPDALKRIVSAAYAGGLAVIVCLKNEIAASVAIGVDTGKRISAATEEWALPLLLRAVTYMRRLSLMRSAKIYGAQPEELKLFEESSSQTGSEAEHVNHADLARPVDAEWLRMLYAGALTGLTVALALAFSHLTRVFSLCVLAAGGFIDSVVVLAGCSSLREFVERRRMALTVALTAVGFLVQAIIYFTDTKTWAAPAGSVIPGPIRVLLALPLKLETLLEHIARANCLGS